MTRSMPTRIAGAALLALTVATQSGCFTLAATGAAVATMAVIDRRTIGAQTEDQAIELKAFAALREQLANPGGISVTSYNRNVLLTGQVLDEQTRTKAAQVVAGLDNVRTVYNELALSERAGLGDDAADALTSTRVKASFVDSVEVDANSVKVVTERGVVYLMGLVTEREGRRAAQLASRVPTVQRVLTFFEYISEAELERIRERERAS